MYIKPGVSISGLRSEMVVALLILHRITGGDFIITSGTEDAPGRVSNSLHPKGLALDVRISDVHDVDSIEYLSMRTGRAIRCELDADLTPHGFDLVWYDKHLHIEYDPK